MENLDFPNGLVGNNPPANAGDVGSIPVLGRCWEDPLEKEMATDSTILAWEIPWVEEFGGATVHGLEKESDMT